jgi:RNA polymerase-binding transcription factor DksA
LVHQVWRLVSEAEDLRLKLIYQEIQQHTMDEGSSASTEMIKLYQQKIEKVNVALRRMDDGDYPYCKKCGRFIKERQLIMLSAVSCVECNPTPYRGKVSVTKPIRREKRRLDRALHR